MNERHGLTGRCMDQQCLQHLLATCAALHAARLNPPQQTGGALPTQPAHPMRQAGGVSGGSVRLAAVLARMAHRTDHTLDGLLGIPDVQDLEVVVACAAAMPVEATQDEAPAPIQEPLGWITTDIHLDARCLHYLRNASLSEAVTPRELRRVQRRALAYRLQGDVLYRITADGTPKRCPRPAERANLITAAHENGH